MQTLQPAHCSLSRIWGKAGSRLLFLIPASRRSSLKAETVLTLPTGAGLVSSSTLNVRLERFSEGKGSVSAGASVLLSCSVKVNQTCHSTFIIVPVLSGSDVTVPSIIYHFHSHATSAKTFPKWGKIDLFRAWQGKQTLENTGMKPLLFDENYKLTQTSQTESAAVLISPFGAEHSCKRETTTFVWLVKNRLMSHCLVQNLYQWLSKGSCDAALTSPVHRSHTNRDLHIGDIEAVVVHGATWPAHERTHTGQDSHPLYCHNNNTNNTYTINTNTTNNNNYNTFKNRAYKLIWTKSKKVILLNKHPTNTQTQEV